MSAAPEPSRGGVNAVIASLFNRGQQTARPPAPPPSRLYPVAIVIAIVLIAVSLLGGEWLKQQPGRSAAVQSSGR